MKEPSLATKIWCFPIWMVWKCIKECRNVWGYLQGQGGCECCGDRWNWKAKHQTRYILKIPGASVIKTVAPLCQECWSASRPDQRVEFYRDHCAMLDEQRKFNFAKDWKAVAKTVLEEK